ncbi:DUF2491 family protein [Aureimonas endophytica]|uniref:DUF2491 family protein n=1 Tax=Aureimonas endophytica TaxID=2027858 RepID=UPI003571236B
MFGWGSSGRTEVPAAPRGPLGVAIGGGIEIDTLSVQASLAGAATAIPVPSGGMMIVAAYGEARLDANTVLSRYYDADDTILQILSPGAAPGDPLLDVSLYRPWDSVIPANAAAWARWRGPAGLIGQPRYDADGLLFHRYWGEGEGRADLVEFVEDIDDGESRRAIHQSCMLYARPLGQAQEMLLINIERDLAAGAAQQGASVEFIIGYGLMAADVRRL